MGICKRELGIVYYIYYNFPFYKSYVARLKDGFKFSVKYLLYTIWWGFLLLFFFFFENIKIDKYVLCYLVTFIM